MEAETERGPGQCEAYLNSYHYPRDMHTLTLHPASLSRLLPDVLLHLAVIPSQNNSITLKLFLFLSTPTLDP